MKIREVNEDGIFFDNGNSITYVFLPDCNEINYAAFEELECAAYDEDFDEELTFENGLDFGFRFGNEGKMYFIPCYSEQDGYYSFEVDIYYNEALAITSKGEHSTMRTYIEHNDGITFKNDADRKAFLEYKSSYMVNGSYVNIRDANDSHWIKYLGGGYYQLIHISGVHEKYPQIYETIMRTDEDFINRKTLEELYGELSNGYLEAMAVLRYYGNELRNDSILREELKEELERYGIK